MHPRGSPEPERDRFTVFAVPIGRNAWHVTVRELPATWTVAFSMEEIGDRARQRIALDLGREDDDFDLLIESPGELYLERRSHQRD